MVPQGSQRLVAVDVGNSRVKVGQFDGPLRQPLPTPTAVLEMAADLWKPQSLGRWLADQGIGGAAGETPHWRVASVNRPAADRLVAWLRREQLARSLGELSWKSLPLAVDVSAPDEVGIDRLLAAVAVNRLRDPARPAIAIDLGTAITVDLISVEGRFQGGAILPGVNLGARALERYTDRLPLVCLDDLKTPPSPCGTDTAGALRAGLYWGAVGGVRTLVAGLAADLPRPPELFLTGHSLPQVLRQVDARARYVPHLVLGGIALSWADERR